MEPALMRSRLEAAPVAILATTDDRGHAHLVPVCFALLADDRLVTAVDHKPKRTSALRRLDHVRARPAVSLLAHHYEDDWAALWWVRADGAAVVVDHPDADLLAPLTAKYRPYAERPPLGPAIVVTIERWTGWAAG
ncbi:MAG TPA: TIGR03668 family PPOX class F420-dependent oxidoreductase [Acidimicrobiia bacterium]|nr:TIGR03668 family PPOX class F420-dependent oxidoreductase [Acidimicrobiia bacterium]